MVVLKIISQRLRRSEQISSIFFQACCSVFPRNLLKDLLDHPGEISVVLIFDICNVYEIFAYDWLYSQYLGLVKMVDMASKFHRNIEDWRLLLVLVRLCWSCETTKLSMFFQISNNDLIPTIFELMYGGKPHVQECIFQ